jgi:hypothetical protein
MTTLKCSTEFVTGDNEQLTADQDLTDFIRNLPADAKLSPVIHDKGNQRDPWPVLVGLRASWEEER